MYMIVFNYVNNYKTPLMISFLSFKKSFTIFRNLYNFQEIFIIFDILQTFKISFTIF
mgnify:FL=1